MAMLGRGSALPKSLARAVLASLTSRAGLLVVLAFLLAAQNTYASTLVASAFLARVGAQGIPLYYILFAAISIPIAGVFSSVIDRFPRRLLFMAALALFIAITLALPMLPTAGEAVPYASYLIVRIIEHLLYSIYYILVADYLTVTDNKRYAGRIALGMAFGGLTGGVLLTLMTAAGGPHLAAWITPALVAALLVCVGWVTKRQHPLDGAVPVSRESFAESLKIIPRLMRRYPMVALMSTAMLVNILLQCLAEFLAYSIYTARFPSIDQLAVFLGMVNAGLSLLGFLVIVLFTGRQLPRLGVPKMNIVYPALDVLAFGVLTITPSLPAGILANVSYDPLEHGIDVPVTTMNYNAIRHRFVGRVRVFIDGVIFPLGLAAAGTLLSIVAHAVDLRVVAGFGLGLSAVLLALHWNIGKHYARGLIEMLRDGAVELDRVDDGLRLPAESVVEIRAMLAGDARTAQVGLEMAARCTGPIAVEEIAAALAKLPPESARAIAHRLPSSVAERLAETGRAWIRQLAFEAILGADDAAAERARPLLADADEGVRAVAAAAVLIANPSDPAAAVILHGDVSPHAVTGALEVLRRRGGGADIAPTLLVIGAHADPQLRATALAAARHCASTEPALLDWAWRAAADAEPQVRREALSLLARLASADRIDEIAERFFHDPSPVVRQAGAEALGELSTAAVPAICRQLQSDREDAQIAAIDALGRAMGLAAAATRLFDELQRAVFAPLALNQRLARAQFADPAICAALDNGGRRAVRMVMHALGALGHHRTLELVRTMINSGDERGRANAIESLASLPQRRFVQPILPLIEHSQANGARRAAEPDLSLLEAALAASDPWLRAAAAVAWHERTGAIPDRLTRDAASVVSETVRQLALRPVGPCPYSQEVLMSRLAFLHGVRLFADTSFDDLVALDHVLESHTYLAGEPIIREGETGDRLCIIYSGSVAVKKGEHVLAQLAAGDFFGEMALFDNEPRSATVTALGEVEVLALQRDRFNSLVRQRPGILMEMCATLVRRLRQAEQPGSAAAG